MLVTLTDQGQARVDAALAGLLHRERMLLAGLDSGERQHLADLMRILLAPFDAVLARSPPGALRHRLPSSLRRSSVQAARALGSLRGLAGGYG